MAAAGTWRKSDDDDATTAARQRIQGERGAERIERIERPRSILVHSFSLVCGWVRWRDSISSLEPRTMECDLVENSVPSDCGSVGIDDVIEKGKRARLLSPCSVLLAMARKFGSSMRPCCSHNCCFRDSVQDIIAMRECLPVDENGRTEMIAAMVQPMSHDGKWHYTHPRNNSLSICRAWLCFLLGISGSKLSTAIRSLDLPPSRSSGMSGRCVKHRVSFLCRCAHRRHRCDAAAAVAGNARSAMMTMKMTISMMMTREMISTSW